MEGSRGEEAAQRSTARPALASLRRNLDGHITSPRRVGGSFDEGRTPGDDPATHPGKASEPETVRRAVWRVRARARAHIAVPIARVRGRADAQERRNHLGAPLRATRACRGEGDGRDGSGATATRVSDARWWRCS